MCCPWDGKIAAFGNIENLKIEYIKGFKYNISQLFGFFTPK